MTRSVRVTALAVALVSGCAALWLSAAEKKSDERPDGGQAKERLFELRTYYASEGKMEALHKRFRDHTNRLFQKHGMELVGYWTPTEGEKADSTLVYILAYPDRQSRDKSWEAFVNDPDWKRVYAESQPDGVPLAAKIDSVFLKPTDYSPIK